MSAASVRERLLWPLSLVILISWSVACVVGFAEKNYLPLTIVTPLMLALSGYVFGAQIVRSAGKDQQ